jgi:hypothetical protein
VYFCKRYGAQKNSTDVQTNRQTDTRTAPCGKLSGVHLNFSSKLALKSLL